MSLPSLTISSIFLDITLTPKIIFIGPQSKANSIFPKDSCIHSALTSVLPLYQQYQCTVMEKVKRAPLNGIISYVLKLGKTATHMLNGGR